MAGTFDKFEMGEVIEKRIPKGRNCNLPTSTIIKAMIILGLGFVDRRLYFAGSYFANWDVEKLLGEGVKAEDLNDDALNRVLDKIHDYGSMENAGYEVYSEISDYGGIKQKWVMVNSEYLKEQELKTFDRHLGKSKVEAEKSLNKVVTKEI